MKIRTEWRHRWQACLMVAAICLPASAQEFDTGHGAPYDEHVIAWGVLPPTLARTVVFHAAGSGAQTAARIYVDGRLQTALRPGGFTVWCMAAGSHQLSVAGGHGATLHRSHHPFLPVVVEGGQTYYFRTDGDQLPIALTAPQAQALLSQTREQIHLLSRAPTQDCPIAAEPG